MKILPNEPCPCGSGVKFKKCCQPFFRGSPIVHPDRLVCTRYCALVNHDADFLWNTLHPLSPRRVRDSRERFLKEQEKLRGLFYEGLTLVDEKTGRESAVYVQWIRVRDEKQDLSYIEESVLELFENEWRYRDGLRKSLGRLGCTPESIHIGDLATLFLHETRHH